MAGTTVLNRFVIGERLGAGGYGTVYRAWDQRLEREVAVKVIETVPASGPRIQREAQAAARLNHPGIVTLFEFAHHEYGREGGRAFLVSELIEGDTVRDLIDWDQLSDHEIAEIGVDLCEALDHAHSRGVVHRDIKPANLIVPAGRGGAKLMDFGIARLTDGEDLTGTGDVLGTLSYMSPEQAEGSPVGPPGDVYSLALTLYEAWTGRNPRRRPTPTQTIRAIEADLPPLSGSRPDLPVSLTDLIDCCLDRDPEYRPEVEDLGRGLEATLPELDRTVPAQVDEGTGPRFQDATFDLPRIAAGAGIGGMIATGMIVSGAGDPFSVALAFVLTALVTLVNARVGFLLAGVGLSVWLATVAAMPGAALLTALFVIPPALLIRGNGRALAVSALGPLLGTMGMAPFLPLLASVTPEWRDRATVAGTGLALTALAESITGRGLLLGKIPAAAPGWERSVADTTTEVIVPVLTAPTFLLSLLVWIVVAVGIGAIVHRSRLRREAASPERFELAPVGSGRVPNAH